MCWSTDYKVDITAAFPDTHQSYLLIGIAIADDDDDDAYNKGHFLWIAHCFISVYLMIASALDSHTIVEI